MNLETRNFEIREFDAEERVVRGIAVPFGETISVGGFKERFERGSVKSRDDIKLFTEHKSPIGRVTHIRDTEAGVEIEARISDTPKGNEVYTLLRDGVLDRFSVGFVPVKHRMDGDVFVRTEVDVREVSVVAFPAYDSAKVSEIRSDAESNSKEEHETMNNEENTEQSDLTELRNKVEDLDRRLAVAQAPATPKAERFESPGEWMKAFFRGDVEIEHRSNTGDTHVTDAYVDERLRRRLERRIVLNAFDSAPLPQDGMNVEYPTISSETGDVAEQALEGDTLNLLSLVTTNVTAPVKTYGGYTQVTKQVVDRAPTSYLNSVFEMMVNSYVKATEAAARTALTGAVGTNTATLAADDGTSWIDLVIDAAGAIEDNGNGTAEFALASRDIFKRLAHLVDSTGRPLFTIQGAGRNSLGNTDIVVPRADIGGLPVLVDSSLPANSFYVCDSNAIKTYESAGAPFRLTDDNITALTNDWSLYGYMAVTVPHAVNITKCDVDLV